MQPHMRRAVREITERLPVVDVVIEMRDARIPFTSENYLLSGLTDKKSRRLLILNKSDLAHTRFMKVRFMSCKQWDV
jgi:ribosome biogenesis GTPase A